MANNENLKPFKPGESGNPNGRPRKSFSSINKELQAKGITKLSKSDLIDAYATIFNCTEEELKNMAKDKTVPYAMRIIIFELNNTKARARAMQDYRDYMFGKATETVDHNVKVEQPLFGPKDEKKD